LETRSAPLDPWKLETKPNRRRRGRGEKAVSREEKFFKNNNNNNKIERKEKDEIKKELFNRLHEQ
jgi:hypothetical protein